jgi:AraC family transcriptional activator of pobA
MFKLTGSIKQQHLVPSFYSVHKHQHVKSDFGLDGTDQLIGDGFGLYSTTNMKAAIGPIRTGFYRIGLMRCGDVKLNVGLETYNPARDYMAFGFPGQIFSLAEPTEDFFAYYMLFREEFIAGSPLLKNKRDHFQFLTYTGVQSFKLSVEEAAAVEQLYLQVNNEIKMRKAEMISAIQLYIQLILIQAKRSYERQGLSMQPAVSGGNALFGQFIKLVAEHAVKIRKVADYAAMLNVSADHLNRTIKSQSHKTAHELIDDMILIEAKAHLLQTELSISELAYHLGFTDPSHINKFFKKLVGKTPLQFRNS